MKSFVVVGGDAAGMSAAMQIVRHMSETCQTIVLEMGETLSYAQCGLPYYIGGDVADSHKLIARTRETFQNKYGIDVRMECQATRVHPHNRSVEYTNLRSGETRQISYDKLLIATGARPIVPNWEGTSLQGVFLLKTIPDAERIRRYLTEQAHVQRCVIIGGGYIGLEMAEAVTNLGKQVIVLDRNDQIATAWDREISEQACLHMEQKGVRVKLGQTVKGIAGKQGVVQSVETETESLPADLVLIAIGVVPNSELAKEAGIGLGFRDAIQVNRQMETNFPNIYAAGDAAVHYHRVKQKDDYIPLGTTANKQGRIAGKNMAGQTASFAGIVGSAVVKIFDLAMARTGLNEKEASDLGVEFESVQIETKDHAGYYPNAEPLTIKLLAEKSSGKLLGGQAIGKAGADKRIDLLAVALYHDMTIDQLLELDLSYAPPFNSVWDPVQQAARRF
ncbi:FAD-dependent oxidoreductase [Effusibacillus dendaii]|uniref:NADH dehydrogenase n=1 Tax=Effusibacillus dendaii TaxID=2743772 RepID=A0A7I8DAI0_9BACL|nr:FAD-dependent oxidoreductase [Effusibacillus dendaii]BCJ85816.1 NADH dehydrogenase [Effusibacillus dendaii]